MSELLAGGPELAMAGLAVGASRQCAETYFLDEIGHYVYAGDTCFGIWEPEKQGMPFVAQTGNPWPLRCDDVAEMRAALEAKGVQFFGDTFDTGVCHMAIFADPDGNQLMLHRRYAPYE